MLRRDRGRVILTGRPRVAAASRFAVLTQNAVSTLVATAGTVNAKVGTLFALAE